MPPIRKSFTRSLDMKCKSAICFLALLGASFAFAEQYHDGWRPQTAENPMTFTADVMAVDNVTKAAVATGHVHAVREPFTLRSEYLERDAEGVAHFANPTCVTTCTNDVGHTHWNVTGDVVYKQDDYVIVRDAWIRLWELPIFYLPYFCYPLNWSGIQWMPGYTGQWGGYVLTKTTYDIAGDSEHKPDTYWLRGDTNLDWRYKQGIGVGQNFAWNIGEFGNGSFGAYHAWDNDAERQYGDERKGYRRDYDWGSKVERERYGLFGKHWWQVTERDVMFVRGSYYSDSYFTGDFMRRSFFDIRSQWLNFPTSGIFWEHLENSFSIGAEFDGRLNKFFGMTQRLPEFYVDVNPMPIGDLPLNYESQNRIGLLDRKYAEYAGSKTSAYGVNPGLWADYRTFRFDTYHRLTMPFRTAGDVLSVVPRLGFHGTYWNDSGKTDLLGKTDPVAMRNMFRSIVEGGVTFAGRAKGWVDDEWQHMSEPYLDVLAQGAFFNRDSDNNRPYVFDAIDASRGWEDQFAGRGRNLPYSYYGITPGWRNAWSYLEENGNLREIVDFDFYAAIMFGATSFESKKDVEGLYDQHKLAKLGKPNYGEHDINVMPGARLKWKPSDDISLGARAEYDSDNHKVALAAVSYNQRLTKDFSYNLSYNLRDYRYWDFSSLPYRKKYIDEINQMKCHYAIVGFEYSPVDWLCVSPFVRYDCIAQDYDSIGGWVDFLTDCLGFRCLIEHNNKYERADGHEYAADTSFGFYIYLRAFGAASNGIYSVN